MRAIAVLAILAFHLDPRLAGGFTGVDVFFVISGFLITSIIWRDLHQERFSISRFYIKRIRRLFPALFAMLLGVLGLVLLSGYRDEIQVFSESALSSLYYASNIFFLTQNDYFSPDLELNPLLHTWSLSVEEQFYILFPFFMLLLARFRRRASGLIALCLVLSLAGSELLVRTHPTAAFFLSPSRFWQFLTGSLVALTVGHRTLDRRLAALCAYSGAALVLGSVVLLSHALPFPGLTALLPTAGAALLIIGGKEPSHAVHKILSSSPMVFIGGISYSLYLWHWPAIVLYKINVSPTLSWGDKGLLVALSFALAYASWRLVESKSASWAFFQRGKPTAVFFIGTLVSLSALFLISRAYGAGAFGAPRSTFESYFKYDMHNRSKVCFLHSGANSISFFKEDECLRHGSGRNVLLLGDSHAAHYYRALVTEYPEVTISQATASGCKPTLDTRGAKRCKDLMQKALNEWLPQRRFDTVIIAARWSAKDRSSLHKTIQYLQPFVRDIIVIGPVIEYKQALPKLLAKFGYSRLKEAPQLASARKYAGRLAADRAISEACSGTRARYVSALERLCPGGRCITVLHGVPVQWDYGHLTLEGAQLVVQDLF